MSGIEKGRKGAKKKRGLHRFPGKAPFLFHFSMGIEESVSVF